MCKSPADDVPGEYGDYGKISWTGPERSKRRRI